MTSEPSDSQQSLSSLNNSTVSRTSDRNPVTIDGCPPESRDHLERVMTPSTSLSNPSSQKTAESGSPAQQEDTVEGQKPTTDSANVPLHLLRNPRPRPTNDDGGPAYLPQAQKRTASGEVKQGGSSQPGSPESTAQYGHSRNTSTASKVSQISDLSNELRTCLSYAMFKVQNGWQSHNIAELEAMASQRKTFSVGAPQHLVVAHSTTSSTAHPQQSPKKLQYTQSLSPGSPRLAYQSQNSIHSLSSSLVNPKAEALSQTRTTNGTSHKTSWQHLAAEGPTLAPPVDIHPRNNRRLHTTIVQPPRLDTGISFGNGTEVISSPLDPSTGRSTPQRRPLSAMQTPSQKTAMEQDAVETLMFMSSPGNTGHFSAFHSNTSPPSTRSTAAPKRVVFNASNGDRNGLGVHKSGSTYPIKAQGVERLTTTADIDQMLDEMHDQYSSSDDEGPLA